VGSQTAFFGQITFEVLWKEATQLNPPSHQAQLGSALHFFLSRVLQEIAFKQKKYYIYF